MMKAFFGAAVAVALLAVVNVAPAHATGERGELSRMLDDFLAAAHLETAHDRFWAEDLVYTSSDGSRFGKADIMSGFDPQTGSGDAVEPPVVYAAEEVDVRLYGAMAVVAFKLVATPADASAAGRTYYYNTGTFLKRDGAWRVVAWQATKIPVETALED